MRLDRRTVTSVVTFLALAVVIWFMSGQGDEATAPNTTAPAVAVPAGFDTVAVAELPPEARATLELIDAGGPFPYDEDDEVFQNREGLLPSQDQGYYREFTVETPGSDDRGPRRLVTGEEGEIFYTEDHYDSFRAVVP